MGRDITMKSKSEISADITSQIEHFYNHLENKEDEESDLLAELYADDIVIMGKKYQAVSYKEVVQQLHHLHERQQTQLKEVFEKYKKVLDGTLGKHSSAKIGSFPKTYFFKIYVLKCIFYVFLYI